MLLALIARGIGLQIQARVAVVLDYSLSGDNNPHIFSGEDWSPAYRGVVRRPTGHMFPKLVLKH